MHDGNFTGDPLPFLGSCRANIEPTAKQDLTVFNIIFLARNFSPLMATYPPTLVLILILCANLRYPNAAHAGK